MTRKEFESLRMEIQNQQFVIQDCGPLQFALKRAEFRRDQLTRLINLAGKVKSKTVQGKVERWRRQLRKVEALPQRLAQTMVSPAVRLDR